MSIEKVKAYFLSLIHICSCPLSRRRRPLAGLGGSQQQEALFLSLIHI